jgi:tetratricopeptide (TPR) repeat protein
MKSLRYAWVAVVLLAVFAPNTALAQEAAQSTQADATARRRAAYKRYLEGERFENQGDFLRAVEAYREAITLSPDSDEPRVALAQLYYSNRNLTEARATAQEAIARNRDSLAHVVLAQLYTTEALANGTVDKTKALQAIAELEESVRIDEAANLTLGSRTVRALALLGGMYEEVGENAKAIQALERLTRVDANSADSFLAVGRLYFEERKYRDAVKAAEQARRIDPTNTRGLVLLAQSLIRIGRSADALDVYRSALQSADDQSKPALTLEYGDALATTGRYAEAIEAARSVLASDPKNVRGLSILADAQRRSGQREQAAKTLEQALVGQDVSESLDLVFSLAETYEELEQFDKAVATYEEALGVLVNPDGTVEPGDRHNAGIVLRRVALAHRLAGHPERVPAVYDRLRKLLGPEDSTADVLQIQDAVDNADYDAAITLARRVGPKASGDSRRTVSLLEAQALGKKGDLKAAVGILEGMLNNGLDDVDVYALMSAIQLDAGDVTAAERTVRRALEIEPTSVGLLITLSSVQDKAGNHVDSESTLRRVLTIDPDNATALNNLGYFLTERKERLDEALTLIQRAVNIDPTNGSFLDSLGWLYYQMGRYQEARTYLERAASYERQSSTIREHLGDLYAKLGDHQHARQQWEAALRLANEKDELERLRGKLRE